MSKEVGAGGRFDIFLDSVHTKLDLFLLIADENFIITRVFRTIYL